MKIVFANNSLDHAGGIESYTTTIADHLQRSGHEVWIHSPEDGFTGDVARALGLRVVTDAGALPDEIDVVLAQDGAGSLDLLEARPRAPQIFFWHSDLFDMHLPPQLEGAVARIVTLWSDAREKAESLAVSVPVVELSHPIDLERFKPRTPLRARPRAVALGNYLTGERLSVLQRACRLAEIELELWGLQTENGATDRPEDVYAEADIVFAKSKAAVEAMACGRAVFVYDTFGSDGWVTRDNYVRLEANCFSGTGASQAIEAEALARSLAGYDPAMGLANRDLAVANHSAIRHSAAVAKLAKEVVEESRGAPPRGQDGLFELARMTRVNWRHESSAFSAAARLQQSELRRGDEEWLLEKAQSERDAALARADELQRTLAAVVESRRWRLLNRLLAPLDRLRRRS